MYDDRSYDLYMYQTIYAVLPLFRFNKTLGNCTLSFCFFDFFRFEIQKS